MIFRARVVVTMDGAPIENGAVAISGERIVDVGRFDEVKARVSDNVVDLGESILLPGLINAHCHLDYTCLRGKIAPPKSFTEWIRAINAEKENLSPEDYVASSNAGYSESRNFGTTTIANLTAFPELIARVQPKMRSWWFAELIDIRDPSRSNDLIDRAIESMNAAENWGLAPHALFTASPNLFRRCEEISRRSNVLLTTHLAESNEEMEMSRDHGGPLGQFLDSMGFDLFESNGETPVAHLLGYGCKLDARWLLVHLNAMLDSDFELLARQSSKPHVVHCPRSHRYFGHPPFEFTRLRELGFNICLGTDSLASNDDLSLFEEMRQFQRNHADVSACDTLELATINGARALGQPNLLGKIGQGFLADLLAIPYRDGRDVFEQIVAFDEAVPWSMIGGQRQI
jgi:cytosine/adenosine deaminase-related metal-dependent hydrolase